MQKTVGTKAFAGDVDFAALNAAEAFLRSIGASYGSNQRGAPTGIMFGDVSISKWRDLDADERAELHGVIDAGDHRRGPIVIRFFGTAPPHLLPAGCMQPI